MSHEVAHCPFLNRSDARCSEVFNLDRLTHAYKYCFDRYTACPRYMQLLSERQHRRGMEVTLRAASDGSSDGVGHDQGSLVQVSVNANLAKARAARPQHKLVA